MVNQKNQLLLIGTPYFLIYILLHEFIFTLAPYLFSFLIFAAPGNTEMVDIGSEEESADARILHEAAAEAKRREVGEGGDFFELLQRFGC